MAPPAIVVLPIMAAISIAIASAIEAFKVEKLLSDITGLPSNYGLPGLVLVFNIYVLMYLGFQVGKARDKYGVKYPTMYADVNHSKNKKNANIFNCTQRSHQNTLEQQPAFLTVMALASQKYPLVAGVSGLVFCVGRLIYAAGYSTGDPKKRVPGALMGGLLAMMPLMGCSTLYCLEQMGIDANIIGKMFIK